MLLNLGEDIINFVIILKPASETPCESFTKDRGG